MSTLYLTCGLPGSGKTTLAKQLERDLPALLLNGDEWLHAVYPDISQVLLLGDKESGVGALLADTRTQGPVKGTGEPLLSLDYISRDEKIVVGEAVLTSGQDRIFPKDLPVGKVVDFSSDPKSPFMKIRVKPAAHLDRLEEVLVLQSRQDMNLKKSPDADTTPLGSSAVPKTDVRPTAPAKKPATEN